MAALAFVLIGVPLVMASLMGNGTMLGPFHTDRDKSLAAGCILFFGGHYFCRCCTALAMNLTVLSHG